MTYIILMGEDGLYHIPQKPGSDVTEQKEEWEELGFVFIGILKGDERCKK